MKVEKMPGGVRDTGGVLFPGVSDTGGVLFPGVSDTGGVLFRGVSDTAGGTLFRISARKFEKNQNRLRVPLIGPREVF